MNTTQILALHAAGFSAEQIDALAATQPVNLPLKASTSPIQTATTPGPTETSNPYETLILKALTGYMNSHNQPDSAPTPAPAPASSPTPTSAQTPTDQISTLINQLQGLQGVELPPQRTSEQILADDLEYYYNGGKVNG